MRMPGRGCTSDERKGETIDVDRTKHLTARLVPGGGYAVRFVPKL
jgi:hypothetical protein